MVETKYLSDPILYTLLGLIFRLIYKYAINVSSNWQGWHTMYISNITETVNPKGCLYKLYILLQTFLLYLATVLQSSDQTDLYSAEMSGSKSI